MQVGDLEYEKLVAHYELTTTGDAYFEERKRG